MPGLTKQKLLIIIVGLLAILILGSVLLFQIAKPSELPIPFKDEVLGPIQREIVTPDQSEVYRRTTEEIKNQSVDILERDSRIGKLITVLPYEGQTFGLSYLIGTNEFLYVIKSGNTQTTADAELNIYLRSQGIQDKSWLYNLITKVK